MSSKYWTDIPQYSQPNASEIGGEQEEGESKGQDIRAGHRQRENDCQ